jgi:retron-type reverse transcriptase
MKKDDVLEFKFKLEDNLFQLHRELSTKTYRHSHYTAFNIQDPKLRRIHKSCVKDRVLHHAIFRILYPIFDKSFIFDSYSCRKEKGTHKAVNRLEVFFRKLSKNNTKNIFALKCDIEKYFDSIDQRTLLNLVKKKINDENTIWLIETIIKSFEKTEGKGLPLGNVTSQLFANIYLNELDQFIKHKLKAKYYLRYCDDFIILGESEKELKELISPINNFLNQNLKLKLHPNKVIIRKHHQGIDFLGYVALPYYRVLRTKTKRRMTRKIRQKHKEMKAGNISKEHFQASLQSYFGVLGHCKGRKVRREMVKVVDNN